MSDLYIPEGYKPVLGHRETEEGIRLIREYFQSELVKELNLIRASAPLFVDPDSGLNDNLNGVERRVSFTIKDMNEQTAEIVQSLAKWKRYALGKYEIQPGHGIYTNMNAIRRDEELDNLHSLYVDQWDWEKVITKEDRTEEYLHKTVRSIYNALLSLASYVNGLFEQLEIELPADITFVTSQELEDRWPDRTPPERETLFCRDCGAMFVEKIGGALKSGRPHDGRAPDYDDWELNGDIILWSPVLNRAFEISSMGIRVDADAMERQLKIAGNEDRKELPFHQAVLHDELPLSIGGGIGQSRICMYFLKKAHIGEVQASIWPQDMIESCREKGIQLL